MAIRKVVGQVTIEERNEIQQLFERRNGLNELATTMSSMRSWSRIWGKQVQNSKAGGSAWARNTNGRALKVATGKSTSRHVKSI